MVSLAHLFTNVHADDAIDTQGKSNRGELIQEGGVWAFRGANGKILPTKQIAYVRFPQSAPPLPKTPLTHTLHLANHQQIAGMLRSVDAKSVEFVTSWGKTLHLKREHVVAIEQARSARILVHDDFEHTLNAWQLEGKPGLDRDRSFHGVASMLLDQPKQRATREWKPALTEGDIRLYFCDPANARATVDLLVDSKKSISAFRIDVDGYTFDGGFGSLKPTLAWHQLTFELRSGRLRVYVDDSCLGETTATSIQGIRITCDAGKLWIDDLIVTQRLPALPRPSPTPDYDMLWLTQGEQLFGRLLHADRQTATLESKLGKRAIAWSQVRGIFFAQPKASTDANDPEITFRPAPGFPLDTMRAKLLRWEAGKLIVEHEQLGEVALERDRLDKIRLLAK